MKFLQYLIEYSNNKRTKPVDVNFAIDWLNNNPKSRKSWIYRGLSSGSFYYGFIQPSKFNRSSAWASENYYTMLLDNLPACSNYPKRSKSIICTTDSGKANSYGETFRVFFKDGSKIGVCSADDIWVSFNNILLDNLNQLNILFENVFWNFKNKLMILESDPETYEKLLNNFKLIDKYKANLKKTSNDYMADVYKDYNVFDGRTDRLLFWQNYMTSNDSMEEYLNKELNYTDNGFKLAKPGEYISCNKEVWSDGDALLIIDDINYLPYNKKLWDLLEK